MATPDVAPSSSERGKIIDKIKKCLALSASSHEHEANAALRQARKLMEAYGISGLDVKAAEAEERRVKAGARRYPAQWESDLAGQIGKAFGCRVFFFVTFFQSAGDWCYIGCGSGPEVAQYAFDVLSRQARRARAEHIRSRLKRCKSATKTRRADLFSEGWVRSVVGTITAFVGGAQQDFAINAYIEKHYGSGRDLNARDRNAKRKGNLSSNEYADYLSGCRAGSDAQLNRGVGGVEGRKVLSG